MCGGSSPSSTSRRQCAPMPSLPPGGASSSSIAHSQVAGEYGAKKWWMDNLRLLLGKSERQIRKLPYLFLTFQRCQHRAAVHGTTAAGFTDFGSDRSANLGESIW